MLGDNKIEVVSGFSGFFHKTIYLKDLPRELLELPLDDIKKELEQDLNFFLFKVTRTSIRGRPGLVVSCNSEAQALTIQTKKSTLIDGWNVTNKQVTSNTGPPIYQRKKCFKIGHRTNWCKNNKLCENCGQSYHGSECDKVKFCVLCNKECGHIALQFKCPTRKLYVKNKSLKLRGNSKPAPNDNDRSRSRSQTRTKAGHGQKNRSVSTQDRQIMNKKKRSRFRSNHTDKKFRLRLAKWST